MSYTPKYIDKNEILTFIQLQNPQADIDRISDGFMRIVDAWIDSNLIESGLYPGHYATYLAADCGNVLYGAAICVALELACMKGWMEWTSGDLATLQFGRMSKTYQKWQPMFFFARGAASSFYKLLPHQTYRMLAYDMIKNFTVCYLHYDDGVRQYVLAEHGFAVDNTSRGWGWNIEESEVDSDDEASEAS